ncbi:hypothetical protein DICPUDRAFT_100061 [Dictyostelium purpureum]|uniref:VASt domain-containing protein n=1 Tax=Dictyostelium purpureum TaxID=5786 RepID=F1A542_DICPU|nr:uncharacterized protein DICPUDRAFT_100061 [Dictyostelium purpureum]EGC28687.1 hypothetical protein DICPUDRAFT_100061 [Dictyostelium purpureum]|eukprot:XP_003294786.1 hypothetical protein DICPUDRAFT_100061 [Dictyostelium purpureum]
MKMTVATKDDSQFHLLFTQLPLDEKLIEEYTCSYNEGAAVSIGKLYISQHHVSYASKIGSTHIVLPIKEITSISKKNSVYLFPNAIEVQNKDHKYFFSAFLSRDLAFATLSTIISQGGGTRTKIFEDMLSDAIEAKDVKERSFIKFSNENEEIELPPPPSAFDDSPFVENPTFSTFRPSTNNNNSNNSNNNSSTFKTATASTASTSQDTNSDIVDDTNSNSSDSSKFGNNKTGTPSPSPSPSNKMLNSKIERKDSFESNGSDNLNNSGGFSSGSIGPSKRNSSQIDILSNHRQSKDQTIDHPLSDQSPVGDEGEDVISSSPSTFEPILAKQESSSSLNNLVKDKSSDNNNTVQSPLKSSQTINPTPPSPQITHRKPHNNKDKADSPPNVSPTNSARESTKEQPKSTTPPKTTPSTTTSPTQATGATVTASAASTTTPPTTASTETVSADSPKVSPISAYERLPMQDKCDHVVVSEFDEAPWSTEKYQISLAEFYEIIIRSDFWGSVNTTHSYTEQSLSEWKQNTNCCIHRNIDFRTAISFKIGPKSTRVAQTQRCKLKNKSELILQSSSVSKDVPYGDSFSVENLLVVQAIDNTSCLAKLSSKIKFTKSVWGLSSMIQKSALQGNKEFFILWNTMVKNQIETYVYNKMKEAKKAPIPNIQASVAASSQPATPQKQPVQQPQPQQQQQQQQQSISKITTTTVSSAPEVPVISQKATTISETTSLTSTTTNATAFTIPEGETLSSTIWNKMSIIEKGVLAGIFFLVLALLFGLTIGIMSNSSTSRSLNNQLYRFSDSLILLDSRINALATQTPLDDGKVTYTTNISKDKMESIRDRLEMANSLLLRAQSMVSTLQAELSLEDLKSQKVDNYYNNLDSSSSGFFGLPLLFTIIIGTVPFLVYKFYLNK